MRNRRCCRCIDCARWVKVRTLQANQIRGLLYEFREWRQWFGGHYRPSQTSHGNRRTRTDVVANRTAANSTAWMISSVQAVS